VQIGAGGIGSYLAPMISRLRLMKEFEHISHMLIDDDIVEEKNLLRQNFSIGDLGENKAEVIASRCSALFGLEINFHTERVMTISNITDGTNYSNEEMLIITAVDNHKTRFAIENSLEPSQYWIDIANDETNGQIFISLKGDQGEWNSDNPGLLMSQIHPEIKGDLKGSCADNNKQFAQTNMLSAMVGFNCLVELMSHDLSYYEVVFNTANAIKKMYFKDRKGG
jgi:molybdopterin/thiamine biosynthesis adenylyltransferase